MHKYTHTHTHTHTHAHTTHTHTHIPPAPIGPPSPGSGPRRWGGGGMGGMGDEDLLVARPRCSEYLSASAFFAATLCASCCAYQASIKARLRLYKGSTKAL